MSAITLFFSSASPSSLLSPKKLISLPYSHKPTLSFFQRQHRLLANQQQNSVAVLCGSRYEVGGRFADTKDVVATVASLGSFYDGQAEDQKLDVKPHHLSTTPCIFMSATVSYHVLLDSCMLHLMPSS